MGLHLSPTSRLLYLMGVFSLLTQFTADIFYRGTVQLLMDATYILIFASYGVY